MKKILIIALTLVLVTGCGGSKEEKEKMLFDSLEKAYVSVYSVEGAGLAVYASETQEFDGKIWYKVAESDYSNIETLMNMSNEVYSENIASDLNKKLTEKYRQVDTELYTLSVGGCDFDYMLVDGLQDNIKKDVKIKKHKMNGNIVFEYKGQEFTAKKDGDKYVFEDQVFTCPKVED